jgi:AcrR family transcriptional regulator
LHQTSYRPTLKHYFTYVWAKEYPISTSKSPLPMTTPERLKKTARHLFAEKGLETVTVREILLAAGDKNGASLNYYFRTKEDLIREIIEDQFVEMNNRWTARLREADAAGVKLSISDLIRLIVDESVRSFPSDDVPVARRLATVIFQRRRHVAMEVFKENRLQAYDQILARIARLTGDLPPDIVMQRLIFLTHYVSTLLAAHEAATAKNAMKPDPVWSIGNTLDNIVDTAVGLILAPVTTAPN